MSAFDRVVEALGDRVLRRGDHQVQARCPGHDDRHASLSVGIGDKGAVIRCFAGCTPDAILQPIGLTVADLFDRPRRQGGRGASTRRNNTATLQRAGCTLATYATAKRLSVETLATFGVREISYDGLPAIRMPYRNTDGLECSVRIRRALVKGADGTDQRFVWRRGSRPMLYGLDRLADVRKAGYGVLVEGESDCHTAWSHNVPALGLPGAATFQLEWAAHLEHLDPIYVVVEPDHGGEAVLKWLHRAPFRDRVRLVTIPGHKDLSDLHVANPDRFIDAWIRARDTAEPWSAFVARETQTQAAAAWGQCASLAAMPDILGRLDHSLDQRGVVGERHAARLVYLAATSRLLERPVSCAVKGPSSGGKSYLVEQVLQHFPPEAYYALSAMSDRALAYSEEPLEHRVLVIYEAAGMAGDFATYLIRSLLSEGRVRYETVEKTKDGIRPRLISRSGPTGLITTTTAVSLHPENETRMLSIPVTDTAEQTHRILCALSDGDRDRGDDNLIPWRSLQLWLASGERRVVVTFARQLAERILPVAIRLRRDFTTLLTLVKAHALLHRVNRAGDTSGRIVATIEDYAAVRALVEDLFDVAVQATVNETVRETVMAIEALQGDSKQHPVALGLLAKRLKLDKGTVSRRVKVAISDGYVQNLETRKGHPMKLVTGDPLPESLPLLPEPAKLGACCSVAPLCGGIDTPPPPSTSLAVATEVIEL